jgi:hypothetical protein
MWGKKEDKGGNVEDVRAPQTCLLPIYLFFFRCLLLRFYKFAPLPCTPANAPYPSAG